MTRTLEEVKGELLSCDKIKRGGQKTVYKARLKDGNVVAFKLVSDTKDKRVLQEIELLKSLNINNIPKIHDADVVYDEANDEDVLYMVEEYVEGISMRDWLNAGNKLTLSQAHRLLKTLLKIEMALEKENIIHRDINPNNIIFKTDGNFCLIDFGLARCLDGNSLTLTAATYGVFTPGYAPTEQLNNDKQHQDVRTDLFQIGVTIYEGCTGKNPFVDGNYGIMDILSRTAALIPEKIVVDGDNDGMFAQLVSILMAKSQSSRPDSASDAMRYLDIVSATLGVEDEL